MKHILQGLFISLLLLSSASCAPAQDRKIDSSKLDSYEAIIVLTYDDGMETQYKTAIPQLNEFELKGTFFLNNVVNRDDLAAWRDASNAGHELGNHTLFHPCPKRFGWIKEVTTENYTKEQILDEIKVVNDILDLTELDKKPKRAFAFPCGNNLAGDEAYSVGLEFSQLITFARTGGDRVVLNKTAEGLDFMAVPSWAVSDGTTYEQMKAYVDKAIEQKGVAIFQFHGVGGQWLKVSAEDHYKLVQYLNMKKKTVRVATFSETMTYIQNNK